MSYVIGDDVLAQGVSSASYFLYDGHGSTRQLVNGSGDVSSRYNYDAYGLTLGTSTSTPETSLLYCGEQYDSTLEMYNLRARYYNPSNGRFNAMDTFEGDNFDPQSLHKYAYAHCDPINGIDPSGYSALITVLVVMAIIAVGLALIFLAPGMVRSYGVAKGHPARKIAIVTGPKVHEWMASVNTDSFARSLRRAGHTVDIYRSSDENEMVTILNSYELVLVLAHGPREDRGWRDANNKPFSGFVLYGKTRAAADESITNADGGETKRAQKAWITANDLDGRITNKKLEVFLAGCSTASTSRMYDAMGRPAAVVGTTRWVNSSIFETGIFFIRDRANEVPLDVAIQNAHNIDHTVKANPTNTSWE